MKVIIFIGGIIVMIMIAIYVACDMLADNETIDEFFKNCLGQGGIDFFTSCGSYHMTKDCGFGCLWPNGTREILNR